LQAEWQKSNGKGQNDQTRVAGINLRNAINVG